MPDPVEVLVRGTQLPLTGAIAVDAGSGHAVALISSGTVMVWGLIVRASWDSVTMNPLILRTVKRESGLQLTDPGQILCPYPAM